MNAAAVAHSSSSRRPLLAIVLFAALSLGASACTLLESPEDHFLDEPDTTADASTDDTTQPNELCNEYCTEFLSICGGHVSNTYADEADCLTKCDGLPAGQVIDYARDSVNCRMNHFGAARTDPDVHCPHASFEGGGQCVGNQVSECEAYCGLYSEFCPQDFDALENEMLGSAAMCAKMCGAFLPAPVGADDELFTTGSIECRVNFMDRMTAPNQPGAYCQAADSTDMAVACRGAIPVVETTCQAFCMIAFNECPGALPFVDLPACQEACTRESLETATCALDLLVDTDSGQPECAQLDPISEACGGQTTCQAGQPCGAGCGDLADTNKCACGPGTTDCSSGAQVCLGGPLGTVVEPGTQQELCANDIDEDCDGEIDEADCVASRPDEDCSNGDDDDGDGMVDCDDTDCEGDPACMS